MGEYMALQETTETQTPSLCREALNYLQFALIQLNIINFLIPADRHTCDKHSARVTTEVFITI
jgi:hypothetical protein